MDPYLELRSRWLGVHNRFLAECDRQIVKSLPAGYVTDLEERIVTDEGGRYRAGLSVWERDSGPNAPAASGGGVATLEAVDAAVLAPPIQIELELESPEWWLEVRSQDGRLVTTVELLSWSNKDPGEDRKKFLARRDELLAGDTNYVEIDLLRGGWRMPRCKTSAAYAAFVSDAAGRPTAGLWPIGLRERLPKIPVPLREPDPPAVLDLQATLEAVFQVGRYAPRIYGQAPEPPLSEADAAWIAGRVDAAGVENAARPVAGGSA